MTTQFRPVRGDEIAHAFEYEVGEPISRVTAEQYAREAADRRYRPEWTWIAERDGRVLARALWWGFPDGGSPLALNCLSTAPGADDPVGLAAGLLAAGHRAITGAGAEELPGYHLKLPVGWRERPEVVRALDWRREAAARAGLEEENERLRFEWTPDTPLPAPEGRLVYTPEPDDDAFAEVFRRVAVGSLDFATRQELRVMTPERQAREDLELYRGFPGDRGWWRLARTPEGELVGLIVPTRNPYGPTVGYIGVVPEWRGHGHVRDMLAETTRILVAEDGAEHVTAVTDTANAPMAAAIEATGYRLTEIRVVRSAAPQGSR
ncbi:GNAT family N-acetyltransferase [Nocardiopsis sp. FIRDI 009]|uniref:GNAT family N-acetyltransferase n=1 Tax=Nocardiopsis sp. FIRDI 009 TaxID=714197 RepID=UPI0018E59E74|nr:GNAT family protein [Nocardiopsis sp. FIRDI 009]